MEIITSNILLVESHEIEAARIRELLGEIRTIDFTLDWASTYEEGLNRLGNDQHDIGVVSYDLGGRNGLDFLREAAAMGCQIPLILLTAQADHEIDLAAMEAGADNYICKCEFSARVLERTIRYAIRHSRTEERLRQASSLLETRVRERTAELAQTNEALHMEIEERKRIEEALREGEAKFRTMAESANAVIGIIQGTRFVYVNPYFEVLTGYSAQEILASDLTLVIHPDFRELVAGRVARRQRGEAVPTHYEFMMLTKKGEARWMDLSSGRINYQGKPAVIGVATDITQRKRVEQALRESEEHLRAILDNAKATIYVKDLDGRFILVNRHFEELFQMDRAEIEGKRNHELFPKEIADQYTANDQRVLEEGVPLEFEETSLRPEGPRTYISVKFPLRNGAGQIYALCGISTDITDRKQAEEALRQSEEKYRLILESAIDYAIFTMDCDGLITSWNRGGQFLLGYTEQEILGKPGSLLFTEEDRQRDEPLKEMEMAEREERTCYERWLQRKDGSRLWATGLLMTQHNGHGIPYGYVKILQDITGRKKMEESLREADRRKDEFLATLAHELRNPLAPIRYAVQMLRMAGGDENPVIARQREVIDRQVTHMSHLLDDLLDVSRITRGKILLQREKIDLRVIVDHSIETVNPLIQEHRHTLAYSGAPEPIWISGDPTRLEQIVRNLLGNAIKYTEPGGHIDVHLTEEPALCPPHPQFAVLRICDTGIGIAAEILPHIFDLYTQADRSLDRSQGGLGIGLTLVRQLVDLHGGTIQAHSDGPGKGSEFTVALPIITDQAGHTSPPQADQPALGSGAHKAEEPMHRILVVDDNVDAAHSMMELLELWGHTVCVAHEGLDALRQAQNFKPDVVMLDIGLPGIDGYEVARRMRHEPSLGQTMLVALTGYGQEEDRRQAREAGFNRHFTKPVNMDELHALLEGSISRH